MFLAWLEEFEYPETHTRVRVNRTLQDRLVKELRLAAVGDLESGNAFLPGFWLTSCVTGRNAMSAHLGDNGQLKREIKMGFVAKDAEWYLAEIVQELTVADDPRNVVWRNLTLVHANSPDDAYEQALHLGRSGDTEYQNPSGKLVTIRFRGLSFLDVIHDPLERGAELMFQSNVGIASDDLQKLLLSKEQLPLFRPNTRPDSPDVASGEIVQEMEEKFGIKRPV